MAKQSSNAPKPATSFDVARIAGVSQTTVSRVYNEKWIGKISEDTVAKVLQAASQLGYSKNAIAKGLSVRRTGIVGIIRATEFSVFYDKMISDLIGLFAQHGIHVMVINAAVHSDINEVLRSAASYQLDGIVLTSANLTYNLSTRWVERDIPIVLINSNTGETNCSRVYSDNRGGTAKMAKLFCDNDLRRVAYVSSARSVHQNHMERQNGFLEAFSSFQNCEDVRIVEGDYSYQSGIDAGNLLFSDTKRPQAVFCANEMMAFGVIDAARYLHGLRVPEDISVAGFDDAQATSYLAYSLTSLQQQPQMLAQTAVSILLKNFTGEAGYTQTVCVPQKLILRTSVQLSVSGT